MNTTRNALLVGGAAATALVTAALAYRRAEQRRIFNETKLRGANAIDETIAIPVYGTKLKALVRGENKSNPVLLVVHGGPGTPDAACAREYDRSLVKDFTVVRYDQRGTGRSKIGAVPIREHSIELYVDDLLRIARALKERFPRQRLLLAGNSWGSVPGLLAAKEEPELFDAYVGVAQVVDMQTSDPWSYDYAAEQAEAQGKRKWQNRLKKIDRNSFFLDYREVRKQRSALFEVGGVMVHKATKREMIVTALRSPDFSLIDLWRTARASGKLGRRLYPQMALTNMFEEVDELNMPVYFIEGTEDHQASPQLVRDFMHRLRAPRKKLLWVDGGHFFDFEKPDAFYDRMVEIKEDLVSTAARTVSPA